MLDESECKNSGGWFKDPFTGEDIGPNYPRVITCKSGDKWTQPAVCFQDGSIVKISGRCWNDDERACYREYRGKQASSVYKRKSCNTKPVVNVEGIKKVEQSINETDYEHINEYSNDCTSSVDILTILAKCDCFLGVSRIYDFYYALVKECNSNIIHHVPRDKIPDAEFRRLCCDKY